MRRVANYFEFDVPLIANAFWYSCHLQPWQRSSLLITIITIIGLYFDKDEKKLRDMHFSQRRSYVGWQLISQFLGTTLISGPRKSALC